MMTDCVWKGFPRSFAGLALLLVGFLVISPVAGDVVPHATQRHAHMVPHRRGDGRMGRDARDVAQSENWAGYIVTNYQTGQIYTAIQGTWTVPAVISSYASNADTRAYSASWLGIGGACEDADCVNKDSSLIQIGTEQDVYSNNGSTTYYAWYEILPETQVQLPNIVSPGDTVTASIACTASCASATQIWTVALNDVTAGWTYSASVSYAASKLSVEWVEEATAICASQDCTVSPLANFEEETFYQTTANGVPPGFALTANALQLNDTGGQTANPSAPSGGDAFTVCWGTAVVTPCTYQAGASPLLASVLPDSRSVMAGGSATAFATIINSGPTPATSCGITLGANIPSSLTFQTTDASTNAATGTPNATVDIPAGGAQNFTFALSPSAVIAPTDIALFFGCANANPASIITGVDTLLLAASTVQTADVVALSATLSNDGILHVPGTQGSAAMAVATANVGAAGTITAAPVSSSGSLPIQLSICQTIATTGQCMSTPSPSVQTAIGAGATPTFAVFGTANGAIAFAPASNRVFVRFSDANGVIRGETSVAIETQ